MGRQEDSELSGGGNEEFFLLKCKIFAILDQSELMENDLHYNV